MQTWFRKEHCHFLFLHYLRCGVPQCVCISITMLSAEECTTGYLSKQFHLYLFDKTRSYAALRAADLDWIVGPGYSLGRVHSGEKNMKNQPGTMTNQPGTMKNHGNQPKTMKNHEKP